MEGRNQQDGPAEYQRQWLEQCRGRQFVRKTFVSHPSLRSIGPEAWDERDAYHVSVPYTGQEFDAKKFEVVDGAWDHEHCHVCNARIEPGNEYWQCVEQNSSGSRLSWELCSECHELLTANFD